MDNTAQSRDNAPDYDTEAPRFDLHVRTWASWAHTAFMRQAVACATAVASYGGAFYVSKADLPADRRSASHPRSDLLVADAEQPEPVPKPACAA